MPPPVRLLFLVPRRALRRFCALILLLVVLFPLLMLSGHRFSLGGSINQQINNEKGEFQPPLICAKQKAQFEFWGHTGCGKLREMALRERVACIDPITGVPMSKQWEKVPYFYPIQIFQFGLGHYNMNRTGKMAVVRRLAKKVSVRRAVGAHSEGRRAHANDGNGTITLDADESVQVKLFHWLPILLFSLETRRIDSEFVLKLERRRNEGEPRAMALIFRHSERKGCVWKDELRKAFPISVVFNIGPNSTMRWLDFVIDIRVSAAKALNVFCEGRNKFTKRELCQRQNATAAEFLPRELLFRGPCRVRIHSLRQQSNAHSEMFHKVVHWMLSRQDERGGWPVPISRTITEAHHRLVLPVGWQSAMAQGLALSFLTRAYTLAKVGERDLYMKAAQKALDLFEVPVEKGGVLSNICGLPWFEEYPTLPGTGVLNGFMSQALFLRGLDSLRHLLHLFDGGWWSLYDLRHIHLDSPPNLASQDYHLLHVSQLRWMYSITGDPYLEETAERWEGYAKTKCKSETSKIGWRQQLTTR
uniref:Heparosan-N-sulfate-glucuronate 5-epimerase n=1 Tax=Globodera rostochiensis TaxID=31243 RepID=A0A914ICD3_GLORO